MKNSLLRLGVAGVIVLVIILSVFYVYRIKTRNSIEILAGNKKVINVLVAGSTVPEHNLHSFYCIVSVNSENGKIGITFLPPEYRIFMNSRGDRFEKIKNIPMGDFNKIQKTLWKDLKLNVPFYVALAASDVERIVDIIEGIDLFILDQADSIPGIEFGINYLDGEKVIKYINSSPENSIYIKYDRIRDILYTLYNNKDRYHGMANKKFITKIAGDIKTNLLIQEIISLSRFAFKKAEIISILLPGKMSENGYYYVDDISYKLFEKEFITQLAIQKEEEINIKIKILNGTDIPGLARKMRNILIREGVSVVEFGTSTYPKMEETIIIDQKGVSKDIRKLSDLLGINKIFYIIDSSQLSSAIIIIGKDYAK